MAFPRGHSRPASDASRPASRGLQDLLANFPDWQVEPVEIVELAPGTFVVRMVAQGAGATSGAPIQLDLAQVWEFDGNQAVRCREFSNFSDALTAARPVR